MAQIISVFICSTGSSTGSAQCCQKISQIGVVLGKHPSRILFAFSIGDGLSRLVRDQKTALSVHQIRNPWLTVHFRTSWICAPLSSQSVRGNDLRIG